MADLQEALQTQDAIGWDNFFEGCIAHKWEHIQDAHYTWCRSRKSGRQWTTALIQKLWDVAWDQWEHHISIVYAKKNAEILHCVVTIDASIRTKFSRGPPNVLPPPLHQLLVDWWMAYWRPLSSTSSGN
jgi:hypothetical protein